MLALLWVLAPATAHAATADYVVLYGDKGDFITGGTPRLFTPTTGQMHLEANGGGEVNAFVDDPAGGASYNITVAAPQGQPLTPGVYDQARRSPFREGSHPGIQVDGAGHGCNSLEGRFEVKDIAFKPDGQPERLWLIFEQHCEGANPAAFGEVKMGEPVPDGTPIVAPSVLRWPANDFGRPQTSVPVWVVAPAGGLRPGAASTTDGRQFPIQGDGCAGQQLAAGGACAVAVGYQPSGPGTRQATLRIPAAGQSLLQGWNYGGRTRVELRSQPGDWVGQGQTWTYTPATADIIAGGSGGQLRFGVEGYGDNGDWWHGTFDSGSDTLVPGRYAGAQRSGEPGKPGLDWTGNGRGCNTIAGEFTVGEAVRDADGLVRRAGLEFVQHCDGGPELRGIAEFRAGDATPPPPWTPEGARVAQEGGGTTSGRGCAAARYAALPVRKGTARGERIRGRNVSEVIVGGAGNDRISARRGNDCVEGGRGKDVIDGGPGRDVIDCGPGRDTAYVTRGDRTKHCERVRRKR